MPRWLFLVFAAILLAALPAHGGIKRTGDPAVSVPASHPSPAGTEAGARQDRAPSVRGPRDLLDSRTPPPRLREGVCATTSICETY